ncbi:MAG: cytochrome c-type biogenesis protein CcmH, partial [Gemmatimonadaceae bacterium]
RDFMARVIAGGAGVLVAREAWAQTASTPAPAQGTTSNLFDMNQDAAKTVRRPPKPGAAPSMTDADRDHLETEIRCQCGCTLDVYICRTTDFSCQVSPAMHRDIISLVEGGYSAQEILDSFVNTYGEKALMAPKREGFNLAGYLVPFAALGIGSVLLTVMLQRMRNRSRRMAVVSTGSAPVVQGTDDEMAKLQAAIRRDE